MRPFRRIAISPNPSALLQYRAVLFRSEHGHEQPEYVLLVFVDYRTLNGEIKRTFPWPMRSAASGSAAAIDRESPPLPRRSAHLLQNQTVAMANKRKKKRSKPNSASRVSPGNLRQQASAALEASRYREAITLFKSLAKADGERSVWEPGLIEAYRGRALELEAKGMDREALAIWENRDQVRPGMVPDPEYVALLFRLGRTAPAMEGYQRVVQSGASDQMGSLRARFAAMYLSGAGTMESLSPDDPVRRDGPAALAALQAYCDRNDEVLSRELRRIPFRSPYRDFATILKALLAIPDDPAAADSLLGRVAPDSPFAPLASAARLARLPEAEFLDALGKSGQEARAFALTLRGWSQDRVQLWREVSDTAVAKNPLRMIGVLKRFRARLGEAWLQRKMRTLMVSREAAKPPPGFFLELSHVDRALAIALANEGQGDPMDTVADWRAACRALREPSADWPQPGTDDALRIALIQRRMATELKLLNSFVGFEVVADVEHSVLLDPDYLPGYLLLITHYRGAARWKEARRVIGMAQKRWPDNIEVLNEALEIALQGGAFKKATVLARQILNQDPINRRARQSLWQGHVAHARKQWGKGLRERAVKELDAALPWADSAESRVRTELLQALFAFDDGRQDAAALAQACERVAAGAVGRFMLCQEAEAMGMPPRELLRRAKLSRIPPLDRESLLVMARQMREFGGDPTGLGRDAVQPFRSALKKAARLPLDRADFEMVCETFRLAREFGLSADFAKAALKHWNGDPLFELLWFQARWDDPYARPVSFPDIERLEAALDRAEEQGDTRTAVRIEDLLVRLVPTPFGNRSPIPPAFWDDEDDFDPFSSGAGETLSPQDMREFIEVMGGSPLGDMVLDSEKNLDPDALLRALEEIESGSLPPPDPRPARGRRRKRAAPSQGGAPAEGDANAEPKDEDDDGPEQLKLF